MLYDKHIGKKTSNQLRWSLYETKQTTCEITVGLFNPKQ